MATVEKRTMSIEARLTDLMTRPLGLMSKSLQTFAAKGVENVAHLTSHLFSIKGIVAQAVAAFGVFEGLEKIKGIAEQAAQIKLLADSVGDAVENLSELQGAFQLVGLKADEFDTIIRGLINSQKKALSGSQEEVAAFRALNIEIKDLANTAPSELFEKIAAGLSGFADQQGRAIVLAKLLPRQFEQILPALAHGIEGFQDLVKQAREAGATVTASQGEAGKKVEEALVKVQLAAKGVGNALIDSFGPRVAEVLEKLAKNIIANKDAIAQVIGTIGTGIVKMVAIATDAIVGLIGFLQKLPGFHLVDENELAKLRKEADLIDEIRSGAATKAASNNRPGIIEQILAGYSLPGARTGATTERGNYAPDIVKQAFDQNAQLVDQLLPREAEIKARLAELEEVMRAGVGPMVQRLRADLSAELAKAVSPLPTGQPATDAQANAAGLPSVSQVDGIIAAAKAAGEAMAKAGPEAFSQSGISVFKKPPALNPETQNSARAAEFLANEEEKAQRAADKLNRTFSGGLSQSLDHLTDQAKHFGETVGKSIGELAIQGIDGLSDALADVITGTKSAKEAFRDFAVKFLTDIAKMISQMLILGSIKTIFGLESGGVMPGTVESTLPVRKFARGGIATSPTLAVFGEGSAQRYGEAFVPLDHNRSIPVTMSGGGGDTYVVNIQAIDVRSFEQRLGQSSGFLAGLWKNRVETRHGMRQTIRKAVA